MVDFQKIDATLLERICSNAKLELTESEKEGFVAEMAEILAAFRALEGADTEGVRPAYHPTGVENVWREDTVSKKRIDMGKSTGAMEDGYVVGPKLV